MIDYIGEFDMDDWVECIHAVETPPLQVVRPMESNYLQPVAGPVTTPQPSPTCRLRLVNDEIKWVETLPLVELKAAKVAELIRERIHADLTYFEFAGKRISVNDAAFKQIASTSMMVSLTGGFHPYFPHAWKAIDESIVPIPDVATWIAFVTALNGAGLYNFGKQSQLEAVVAAATTVDQVHAVRW